MPTPLARRRKFSVPRTACALPTANLVRPVRGPVHWAISPAPLLAEPAALGPPLPATRSPTTAARVPLADLESLAKVVTTWAKKRALEIADRWVECDHAEFDAHWLARGRTPKQCKRKWEKATSAKKVRKGLCYTKEKVSKKGKTKKSQLSGSRSRRSTRMPKSWREQ